MRIEIEGLSHAYAGRPALRAIDLDIAAGTFVVRHTEGMYAVSLRSTATDLVEFSVSATEFGSVTRLVSTLPVLGA